MPAKTRNEYKRFNFLRLNIIENEKEKCYPIDTGYMGSISGNYMEFSDEGDYEEYYKAYEIKQ